MTLTQANKFLKQYADRIIELKDGKILSDVTKTQEQQKLISTNVTKIGSTLCINNSEDLTDNDFDQIKNFLKTSKGNVLIANDQKEVKNFKDLSRITDDGKKEVFVATNENDIPKQTFKPEDSKFISSRLPARHAFKMGVSGLTAKPIRLIFTILLCLIAFTIFAVSSTMMLYDKASTLRKSLETSTNDVLILTKNYHLTVNYYQDGELKNTRIDAKYSAFTPQDLTTIKSTISQNTAVGATIAEREITNLYSSATSNYYQKTIDNAIYLEENSPFRNKIYGNYPTAENQVVISSHLADSLVYFGLKDSDNKKVPMNFRNSVIGKTITFNHKNWVITGIYQTPELDAKFDSLKERYNEEIFNELNNVLSSNLYSTAIVSQAGLEKLLDINKKTRNSHCFSYADVLNVDDNSNTRLLFEPINTARTFDSYYLENKKTTLEDGQVLLATPAFYDYLSKEVNKQVTLLNNSSRQDVADLLQQEFNDLKPTLETLKAGGKYDILHDWIDLTDAEILQYVDTVNNFITHFETLTNTDFSVTFCINMPDGEKMSVKTFSVVGLYIPGEYTDYSCYLSPNDYTTYQNAIIQKEKQSTSGSYGYNEYTTKYIEPKSARYSIIVIELNRSTNELNELVKRLMIPEQDDSIFKMSNPIAIALEKADEIINGISSLLLIISIVLAGFASLLLANFISVSISYKTKDIGILRAVGARSTDVFKIFFSESFIIMLICITLSIVATTIVCNVLNVQLATMLAGVAVFVFGTLNILLLIVLALVSTILATYFPVNVAAKKKPVESIRAL